MPPGTRRRRATSSARRCNVPGELPQRRHAQPTFELTYWRWGLETAQTWRERLGMPREPEWDRVLDKLAKPLVVDGKYAFTGTTPDSYTNPRWNDDHPAVLGAFGMLPGPGIDRETMRSTFDWVWQNWNWPNTWGWDYPLRGDVRRPRRRAGPRRRRPAPRHAEELLSRERPQPPAPRPHDLSARQRRPALRRRDDGRRLGRRPRPARPRLSGRRQLDRAFGAPAACAMIFAS